MLLPENKKRKIAFFGLIFAIGVSVYWLTNDVFNAVKPVASMYDHGKPGKNAVSICVNVDWGEDYIPEMLEIFAAHDGKATFFLTGRWTEKFPDVAKEIKKAGMEIGNHGYKHDSPNHMSYEENLADIQKTEDVIDSTLHVKTMLFAPAAGEKEEHVQQAAEDAGYRMILWSVDTIDWQKPSPETIVARVESKVEDGSVILMHPTENTVAALDGILTMLEKKGLRVVPISELIKE